LALDHAGAIVVQGTDTTSVRLENAARHLVELAERFMDRANEAEQRNRQTQN
jgi:hypothetical protein